MAALGPVVGLFRELKQEQTDASESRSIRVHVTGAELVQLLADTGEAVERKLRDGGFEERVNALPEQLRVRAEERLAELAHTATFLATHIDEEREYHLALPYFLAELPELLGLADPMNYAARLPVALDD